MNNQNLMQLIVVLLIFGSSGILALFRKLAEKRAIKRQQELQEEARNDMLRRGKTIDRAPPPPSVAPPNQLESDVEASRQREQMLAERRARLEQLRQQRAQEQTSQSDGNRQPMSQPMSQPQAQVPTGSPGGPIIRELWPGGPVVIINPQGGAPTAPASQPMPMPQPVQPMQPSRSGWTVDEDRSRVQTSDRADIGERTAAAADKVRRQAKAAAKQARHRSISQSIDKPVSTEAGVVNEEWNPKEAIPRTPAQWRQAFIMTEVFGPAVANRKEHLHD